MGNEELTCVVCLSYADLQRSWVTHPDQELECAPGNCRANPT